MEHNRVLEALLKLSDQFHEMEGNGVDFTEAEDDLWCDLTNIIVTCRNKENS